MPRRYIGYWILPSVSVLAIKLPETNMSKPLGVFSIVRDETIWTRIWLKHYLQHVDASCIYILDHDSTDMGRSHLEELRKEYGFNLLRITHDDVDYNWLTSAGSKFQQFLLNSYDAVLYADIDEIIIPRPGSGYEDLVQLADYNLGSPRNVVRCCGYEVVHQIHLEEPIDFSKPLLRQRSYWYHCLTYSKPVLTCQPIEWMAGFHEFHGMAQTELVDKDLLLIHLHKIDLDYAEERHKEIASRNWNRFDLENNLGFQNRITNRTELVKWFQEHVDYTNIHVPDAPKLAEFNRIPESIRDLV